MSDMGLIFCACVYEIKLTDLTINQNLFSTIMIWMLLKAFAVLGALLDVTFELLIPHTE